MKTREPSETLHVWCDDVWCEGSDDGV